MPTTRPGVGRLERRVVIKAEVVWGQGKEPYDNPHFVITTMKQSSQWLYEKVYCSAAISRTE
jgi:hypothetical protein